MLPGLILLFLLPKTLRWFFTPLSHPNKYLFLLALTALPITSHADGYVIHYCDFGVCINGIYSDSDRFMFQGPIIDPVKGSPGPYDPSTGKGGDFLVNNFYNSIIMDAGSYTLELYSSHLGNNESLSAVLISAPSGSTANNISFTNNSSIGKLYGAVNDTAIVIDSSASNSSVINNGNIFSALEGIHNAGNNTVITNASTLICSSTGSDSDCSASTPTIFSWYANGIENVGTISSINNGGAISSGYLSGIKNLGAITSINNSGTIWGQFDSIENLANDDGQSPTRFINTITNSGTINGGIVGINNGSYNGSSSTINEIINTSTGTISAEADSGLYNLGSVNKIQNAGTIDEIQNVASLSHVGTITNTGSIGMIINRGSITTLNNLQNHLNLTEHLPANYNIIVNSPTNYGKFSPTNFSGDMVFGISPGSSLRSGTYQSVLTTDLSGTIVARSGVYDALHWSFDERSNGSTEWDLTVTGISASKTQLSLEAQADSLRSAINLQKVAINQGLNYDCTTFDSNGLCIAAGGRYTSLDANSKFSTSNALVITSVKLGDDFRVGAYLDQNISNRSKDISLSNGRGPMGGLFLVLSEDDQTHEGYEFRLAANYQSKDATISREAIGDAEAGSGKASLNAWGVLGQVSYAFKPYEGVLLTQYVGLRYSEITRAGYEEGQDISIPLSYDEVKDESTVVLAGLKLNFAVADDFNVQANLGIEDDIQQKFSSLVATGIDGLTPVAMSNNRNKFRGVAGLGAALNISKYQVLRGSINYQQLPYQSSGAVTGMVTYELGL